MVWPQDGMSLCDCVIVIVLLTFIYLLMSLQVYPPNLHVDQQDIININNQHLFFSYHVEQYFVAIICTWSFNNMHKGLKTMPTQTTQTAQSTISTTSSSCTRSTSPSTHTRTTSFYTTLLLHIYCFIKHSLFLYTSSFVCLRDQLKQMKVEMQRKLVHNKYEASASLMALALRYVFTFHFVFCFNVCM